MCLYVCINEQNHKEKQTDHNYIGRFDGTSRQKKIQQGYKRYEEYG